MAIAQKAVSQVQSVVDLVKAEKDKAVAAGDLATQAGADAMESAELGSSVTDIDQLVAL